MLVAVVLQRHAALVVRIRLDVDLDEAPVALETQAAELVPHQLHALLVAEELPGLAHDLVLTEPNRVCLRHGSLLSKSLFSHLVPAVEWLGCSPAEFSGVRRSSRLRWRP